ncbi:MAG: hypothetical protein FWE07_08545 [Turicibacter sp.]|nr:hypothetical protein [Turicibacter sp.]
MSKLPLRLSVLKKISESDAGLNIKSVMLSLEEEYGTERQFHEPAFLDHLLALKESGLIDESQLSVDESGKLIVDYVVSAEGKVSLQKYLPKKK